MKTELLTTLKRQATKILSELHESKEPVLITEHGKPPAYLVDFEDYETLQRRRQCGRFQRSSAMWHQH